jgi:4-hydroxythreonine-4-phosphate dehydrogenase
MGDPAGSGPEIVLKALRRAKMSNARFILVGDLNVFREAAKITGIKELYLREVSKPSEALIIPGVVNVVNLRNVALDMRIYGSPSVLGGKAAYECIVRAVDYALQGTVHAIVTAPISKESLNIAGYNYPGHTELLAKLTGVQEVNMMLVSEHMRVVHVTTHLSMREALQIIKKDRIVRTLKLTNESLKRWFGFTQPRIGVAGLNPHAGESGLFGNEEIKEISPAIAEMRRQGMDVSGPHPPDTIFYRAYKNKEFDAVVAMYHDQGHIAVKMVGLMKGVNVTLGLPIIRVSPDHGTVWGKAGKGTADENATVEAIRLAIKMSQEKFELNDNNPN